MFFSYRWSSPERRWASRRDAWWWRHESEVTPLHERHLRPICLFMRSSKKRNGLLVAEAILNEARLECYGVHFFFYLRHVSVLPCVRICRCQAIVLHRRLHITADFEGKPFGVEKTHRLFFFWRGCWSKCFCVFLWSTLSSLWFGLVFLPWTVHSHI